MSCGCPPGELGAYARCSGFPVYLTDIEGPNGEWAAHYAQVVGAPFSKDNATTCSPWSLVANVILCHRFPYHKSSPGDCGKDTKINITGAGTSKALGLGGAAAGAASGVIGLTTGLTGTAALEAGGLAAAGAIAGIAAFGAGLIALPFAFIAHHDAAVALEESVLCSVTSGYNGFADQLEPMLRSGQITLAQANDLADKIQQQIIQGLSNGLKECNARCYYTYAIKALTLFCKERFYPSIVPQAQSTAQASTSGVSASGAGKATGIAAIVYGLAASHPLIALGGAVLTAASFKK